MSLTTTVVSFILTLLALAFAAELLARGTEELEEPLGQGLAGGIVLGLLTALPETIITVFALVEGKFDVALGSAVGGNVILFTLGIGLVGLIYFLSWKKNATISSEYKVENKFLIFVSLLMLIILIYGKIDVITGIILIAVYVYYVYYRIRKAPKINDKMERVSYKKVIAELGIGTAILLLLSEYFVNYVVTISSYLGVPVVWLSLVITPIAAELEEKISGIRLAMRREDGASLALISFVGSKIENATLLLGIIGLFTSYDIYSAFPEYIAALVSNFIGIIALYNRKISIRESILLIAVYGVIIYLTYIR